MIRLNSIVKYGDGDTLASEAFFPRLGHLHVKPILGPLVLSEHADIKATIRGMSIQKKTYSREHGLNETSTNASTLTMYHCSSNSGSVKVSGL